MPELTPLEAAETLETAYGWQKNKGIPCVDAALFAASYLRRIAAGEYKQVVHARWIDDENGITQICSNCGEEHEWLDYRATYCDVCGALMDGKDDSHETD